MWEIVRQRPANRAGLAACQGCSDVFIQRHGQVGLASVGVFQEGVLRWLLQIQPVLLELRSNPSLLPLRRSWKRWQPSAPPASC